MSGEMLGRVINDQYKLIDELGRGSFTIVYKARDTKTIYPCPSVSFTWIFYTILTSSCRKRWLTYQPITDRLHPYNGER